MAVTKFRALVVEQCSDGTFARHIAQRDLSQLPPADVLVEVRFSSLNYKDALSASGHKGITRHYPHTPGIDAAGVVRRCATRAFAPGDEVIVTGYDLGMNTSGGLAGFIAVPESWVVRRPDGIDLFQSMALGTAGLTAAMCVHRLGVHGMAIDEAEVLVSGATGGVGSLAVALLAQMGHRVVALTGKTDQAEFLRRLGAAEVVDRNAFLAAADKPLLPARWGGAVDTVGGEILDAVLKGIRYGGAVACCGMAASPKLSTTVYPLILRDVSLLGIASGECPMDLRRELWARLAGPWKIHALDAIARQIPLVDVDGCIDAMLEGRSRGRVVVKVD